MKLFKKKPPDLPYKDDARLLAYALSHVMREQGAGRPVWIDRQIIEAMMRNL